MFAAADTATQQVLAIPALARALREVHLAGWTQCSVHIRAGWQPSAAIGAEIARLAPGLRLIRSDTAPSSADVMIVDGERLASQRDLASAARWRMRQPLAAAHLTVGEAKQLLQTKSRELLDATAKSGDGIVTRYFNRPVSQRMTRLLLSWFGAVHPNVATAGTACIGAVMFQAASVFDGVDGEIARATFRATPPGASIDSLVDAVINILFFVGVIANLYSQGDGLTAGAGFAALIGFVFGTVLLGHHARQHRGVIDFNAVKRLTSGQNSRAMQVLTWLTMRDFYAFAALVLIGVGLVTTAVWAFAIIVAGWLAVVCFKLVVQGSAKPGRGVARA